MNKLFLLLLLVVSLVFAINLDDLELEDREAEQEAIRYGSWPPPDRAGLENEINTCNSLCGKECVCCTYRCRYNGMLWKKAYCGACPRNEMCALEEENTLSEDSCMPVGGGVQDM